MLTIPIIPFMIKNRLLNMRKLTSVHPNSAVTTEMQSNSRLSSLDVLVDNSGPNLELVFSVNLLIQNYTRNGNSTLCIILYELHAHADSD